MREKELDRLRVEVERQVDAAVKAMTDEELEELVGNDETGKWLRSLSERELCQVAGVPISKWPKLK